MLLVTRVFASNYAQYYDMLYSDKDYDRECDFLEQVFNRFAAQPTKSILDVGCGTGAYSIRLGRRGYGIQGIDLSTSMISIAREKARREKVEIDLEAVDVRRLNLGKTFDVCTCMFAVIDYLLEDRDIENAMRAVRAHLHKGSLFVFDFWNGSAVLKVLPSVRTKTVELEGLEITRVASPRLNTNRNICEVDYKCTVRSHSKMVDEFEEKHVVRYLFQDEIKKYLERSGFDLRLICPFPELNGEITPDTWNLAAVAVAK